MTQFHTAFEGHEIVSKITENAFYSLFDGDVYKGLQHPMFESRFYEPVYGVMWATSEYRDHMTFQIKTNKIPEMASECRRALDEFVVKHAKAVMRAVDILGQQAFKNKFRIRVYMELSTMRLEDGRIGKKLRIESTLVDVSKTGNQSYEGRSEKLATSFIHSTRKY